ARSRQRGGYPYSCCRPVNDSTAGSEMAAMPVPAPVITATFPFKRIIFSRLHDSDLVLCRTPLLSGSSNKGPSRGCCTKTYAIEFRRNFSTLHQFINVRSWQLAAFQLPCLHAALLEASGASACEGN